MALVVGTRKLKIVNLENSKNNFIMALIRSKQGAFFMIFFYY
jgi:hypothetical protein